MTERLNAALRRLPDQLQDEVADFAEFLADRRKPATPAADEPPRELRRLDISSWAGKLEPLFPGETGVDASHAATAEMLRLAEGKLESHASDDK